MRILVTGGAGFLGSRVVAALGKHDVSVLDLAEGGDVTDAATCRAACAGVEVVVHAAAVSQIPDAIGDPARTRAVNAGGTRTMLDACVDAGVRRFVHLSSAKVYGEPTRLPTSESDPRQPLTVYGATKAEAELVCREYDGRLEVTCLRLYSVYGPGQRLRNGFIGEILDGTTLAAMPAMTRDYLFVDDAVAAIVATVLAPRVEPAINLGSGRACTLRELAEHLGRTATYERPRPGTVRHAQADISLARATLGWTPRVTLEEGLARTLRWIGKRG